MYFYTLFMPESYGQLFLSLEKKFYIFLGLWPKNFNIFFLNCYFLENNNHGAENSHSDTYGVQGRSQYGAFDPRQVNRLTMTTASLRAGVPAAFGPLILAKDEDNNNNEAVLDNDID